MAKFDSDFALFGTLAADLVDTVGIAQTKITYVNKACVKLYGNLEGELFGEVLSRVCGKQTEVDERLEQFQEQGHLVLEGKLSGRFVKFHTRIINGVKDEDDFGNTGPFLQAGITDITESVILKKLLYGTSEALKRAALAADEDTGLHINRINRYSELLARHIGYDDIFIEQISKFAQLHDIGKIQVADLIRLPRKLTDEEFDSIKKHTVYGAEMVDGLEGLEMACDIALDHHEKWDGSGYPYGKKGEEISFAGRIVAIVDVFDALVSVRPYKKAMNYQRAEEIFRNGDGRVEPGQFDPQILSAFLTNYDGFCKLHHQYQDKQK